MANSTSDPNADLRAARRALENIGEFDDDGKPCAEDEWRHKFLKATRDVTNKQRAELWADCLAYRGEAYKWLEALKNNPVPDVAKEAEDWSTLKPLIEARWPTPVPDPNACEEAQRIRFASSRMEVELWADILRDPTNPSRPQQAWAMQHRARGMACDSTDRDRVLHTLHVSLPAFAVNLLPERYAYGKKFDKLCKDIGDISNRALYDAWRDRSLIEAMGSLAVSAPPPSHFSHTPLASAAAAKAAPAPATLAVTPATPNRGSQVSFQGGVKAAVTQPPPTPIPPPAFSSFHREHPPHMPPAPPATPMPAPVPAAAPPTIPNTSADVAQHRALLLEYDQKFGRAKPSAENPFPLTPGTLQPGRGVCTRCGRGMHSVIECPNDGMDERERFMRNTVLNPRTPSRRFGRAGGVPGTPTPSARVRDTWQLESGAESEGFDTDFYDSENEQGQR